MKKLLLMTLGLALTLTALGCSAEAQEEVTLPKEESQVEVTLEDTENVVDTDEDTPELVECYAGFGYEGTIVEVVNVGDNPETDFEEGSLVIEINKAINDDMNADHVNTIIVYVTDQMSTEAVSAYQLGDKVQLMVDYELNFEGAKDLPHVSPLTLFKVDTE